MRPSLAPDDRLVEYLLGRMSEEERLELRERLFRDEDLDEELLATSDELVRAYLAGELPEEDRSRFETHFLGSPENREHLALMRDVLAAVDRVAEEHLPAVAGRPAASVPRSRGWAAAAAAILLAVGLVVVVAVRRIGQGETRATASPLQTVPAMPSARTTPESPMPRVPPPATARVVRFHGRSGTQVTVRLSPSIRAVRMELTVDPESLSFDAAVLAADGTPVWRAERAPSVRGQPLVLEVPAQVFASGRYTLRVEGESLRVRAAPILEYRLQVVRER
jgi:hypothetical protein